MGRNTNNLERWPMIKGLKLEHAMFSTAADITLDDDMPTLLEIDPTADNRKVIMQAATEYNRGMVFVIYNVADAAESILVRTPGDAGLSGTIAQGEIGIVINIGGIWRTGVMANT
jgi:hypothetical protein